MHSLYLTIFDQGDAILDSAVFLDNLRFETIDAAKCKSLSADPYDGLTGVSPVAGNPPKLSKDKSTLTFPVSCNLPPGPVSCNVTAAAGFKNLGQFVAAVNASHNQGIDFVALRALMVAPNSMSLGQAVQQVRSVVRPQRVRYVLRAMRSVDSNTQVRPGG